MGEEASRMGDTDLGDLLDVLDRLDTLLSLPEGGGLGAGRVEAGTSGNGDGGGRVEAGKGGPSGTRKHSHGGW